VLQQQSFTLRDARAGPASEERRRIWLSALERFGKSESVYNGDGLIAAHLLLAGWPRETAQFNTKPTRRFEWLSIRDTAQPIHGPISPSFLALQRLLATLLRPQASGLAGALWLGVTTPSTWSPPVLIGLAVMWCRQQKLLARRDRIGGVSLSLAPAGGGSRS